MNQQNLASHAQVLKKNKINANIPNTEQLVRRMMKLEDGKNNNGRVPLHKKATSQPKETDPIDEDKIMESIDNLDMLLANMKDLQNGQGK